MTEGTSRPILVTGAAGKTGQAVIRALVERHAHVRALIRHQGQRPAVQALGVSQVFVGDLMDPAVLATALSGTAALYLICPNMHPNELALGQLAMAAAQYCRLERFVYHSVLHPQTEAMPHHWAKLRVEEALLRSGLAFTVLQPTAYMQNVLAYRQGIVQEGVYPVPYAEHTRLSLVDLEDVAQVAAQVLTEDGHAGASYQLVGEPGLTQLELVALIRQVVGRPVQLEVVPLDLWKAQSRAAGLDDHRVETLAAMFRYYEAYGLPGNPNVLSWLLGRPPTSFAAFLARTLGVQA